MINVPLSVLDLAPVQEGSTAGDGLAATTELARRTEAMGYARFWVAEHHNMPGIASAAPSVLLAHLAAATSRIRVGSGGVMLPNHAPLVVAEQFGTLHALHPGRIDLGIGRAPGTDQATALALRRTKDGLSAESFPQELAALLAYFRGTSPDGIAATPGQDDEPEIWLLGSSGYSAQVAAILGVRFAFAHHISPNNTVAALELYRENFRPSEQLERPHAMVAAAAICADTDEQAELLSRPRELAFLHLMSGRPRRLPTPEEAADFPANDRERHFAAQRRAGQLLGSPETVRRQLTGLIEQTGADEIMLNTLVYDIEARARSFELIRKLTED
ncbi:LLM class flavin-dependent oxidoreductase [Nocardia cyriacigeorgica]|uniref:LLM class flavin-dependent oxidoreductase n=1 Tax=Nocardia cyriacigeorgica TaxID=135487 RepID=A0A6P1CY46_9NOCA|nr:LLM class flavin-dependent oxidoreductase [Nocardia cyriacigeorgica]MBF6084851.1 LLM class flavin-dependent oxidoreductase [Nocardia cyriacigeorgica]NEW35135.1 LLM class flavin-dependent oxidoreductase [Nocardia cyriacigeorgica]BDT86841.1 FMN-linked alkanal monooxygenase [Nocardia cyriacigeorgica]